MTSPASWQHDTLVQTLYSGRCGAGNALYFDYALAQARADVFFSLLFGSRIICSAGTFFDSSIAIRVFGELFSNPRFMTLCEHYKWYPLHLNTDNPRRWAAKDYLLNRWRDPNIKLGLFREDEASFEAQLARGISDLKKTAADCIQSGQYARLKNTYEPFLADHEVPCYDEAPIPDAEQSGLDAFVDTARDRSRSSSAWISPILTNDFAEWLHSILDYLSLRDCFVNMDPDSYNNTLSKFSPLSAVQKRTDSLPHESSRNYALDELRELNRKFKSVVGDSPLMNAFHRHGPAIYGHYFPLINHWIEVDWHTTRHAAYTSSTCLLSSNWEARQLFDIDPRSKVHYWLDTTIDDSLRPTQEGFGELDWSLLLDVVSDPSWQSLIWKIRDAKSPEEVAAWSDQVLDLLSRRITSFDFQLVKGRLLIAAKTVTASAFGAAAVCTSHFDSTLAGLLGVGVGIAAGRPSGEVFVDAVLGALWQGIGRWRNDRRLRTAVVPRIYLGEP
jgi:hypothetical protein